MREGQQAPRDFYERLWRAGGGDEDAARGGFQADVVARAVDWLGPIAGLGVLEIGPGMGRESVVLLARGARLVALDLARTALERTRSATDGQARLVLGRAEALPLAAGSVERVFLQTLLMHLDLDRAAAEWARVLRPGGRVVVLEPIRGNPLVALYRRWLSPCRATRPRYVTTAEIVRAAQGFRLVRHEQHYLLAVGSLALPARLRSGARWMLGRLDRELLRIPPLRKLCWMTLVELERL